MREVLDHYRPQIDASNVLDRLGLTSGGYFLVSAHREENVDLPSRLDQLLDCLVAVRDAFGLPLLVSTHPRTRKRLEARRDGVQFAGITFHEPFGFHDYNKLQLSAACVLSDSGTIAEEATILGFPAITLRDSIERPEALDTGGIVMTGLHPGDLVQAVLVARDGGTYGPLFTEIPQEYKVDNTAERVIRFILSTCRRHRSWAGIRSETDARPPSDLRAFSRRRAIAPLSPDLRA
jgi:UDP-N-acetylglucosamine 2-epimerase